MFPNYLITMSFLTFFVSAAPAEAKDGTEVPSATQGCPGAFGDEALRSDNRVVRRERLVLAEQGPHYIDVVDTVGWSPPEAVRFRGLELLDTPTGPGGERVAVVRLDERFGSGCSPGLYRLRIDDSIGTGRRLVAILDGMLLIERDEPSDPERQDLQAPPSGLEFLQTVDEAGTGRPLFKMSWRAPFDMAPSKGGGARGGRPAAPRAPRRKPPKKR